MAYLVIGILIAVFSALFALSGCQSLSKNKPSIEELAERGRKRVRQWSIEEAGYDSETSAMCYFPANFRSREYVCPKCGMVTKYPGGSSDSYLELEVFAQYRVDMLALRGADRLHGIVLKLDESQFCRFCNPVIKEPKPGLIIFHPGESAPRYIYGINEEDLVLICEYILGRTTHFYGGSVTSIEEHYNRLNELLDMNLKITQGKNKN